MSVFKSLESIDITKETVDGPKMSTELNKRIRMAVVNGMLESIAEYCYCSGTPEEELKKKLLMIINDFRSTGDVEARSDRVESMVRNYAARASTEKRYFAPYASTYTMSSWHIVEDPCIWDAGVYDDNQNLTKEEQNMMADYREAREAYNNASQKLSSYIHKVADSARKDIIIGHSHVLEQAAPTWLKEVSQYLRVGDAPDPDSSDTVVAEG